MQARDVMTRHVVSVVPDTPVEQIARILLDHRISAVPVIDANGEVIGIVSEGDLMRRSESDTHGHSAWWLALLASRAERAEDFIEGHARKAAEVMTRPVITVDEETQLVEVADILERHRINRVPVVRENKLVGIVSRADLLRGLAAKVAGPKRPGEPDDETIRKALTERIRRETGVQERFLHIAVTAGIVHVCGVVRSEEERNAVRVAAESTAGVRGVEDHIDVLAPEVFFS